jgi:hypothetical protein
MTMPSDYGSGNPRVDAALKKGKGNGQNAEGDAAPSAADSAKKMAAAADEKARGFIGHWPYASLGAVFALGLFFGALAGLGR